MELTKPAGCFLQILGACALLIAPIFIIPDADGGQGPGPLSYILAATFIVIAYLLLKTGRKPALKK